MPLVQISMFPGRTNEARDAMIREVTEAVVRTTGAPPEAVTVIVHEIEKSHWARAGVPHSQKK